MSFISTSRNLFLKLHRQQQCFLKGNYAVNNQRFLSARISQIRSHSVAFTRKNGIACGGIALGLAVGYTIYNNKITVFAEAYTKSESENQSLISKTKEPSDKNSDTDRKDNGVGSNDTGTSEELYANELETEVLDTGTTKKKGDTEEHFDWPQLVEIIAPYWKRLLFAVGVSIICS